ncbi:unnamed protein product [Knipowitschia caucasica]|uniref:Uncharacterized protein n=1 Tax=Knipowitschia caucasica TaxID=637954 RepID=A0AAV2JUQ9_KNICA
MTSQKFTTRAITLGGGYYACALEPHAEQVSRLASQVTLRDESGLGAFSGLWDHPCVTERGRGAELQV